jgi:SAM-dependent methyltransferase
VAVGAPLASHDAASVARSGNADAVGEVPDPEYDPTTLNRTGNIWHRGEDYDILGESEPLRDVGVDWLIEKIVELGVQRPLLVDFGCWSGRHLRLLERVGRECSEYKDQARETVVGIDQPFAKERVAEARRAHPGFQVFDTGIANTGLGASSVDAAICWRVLHNLTAPGELTAAIAEFRRVLRDRAPLIVAVRAAFSWMDSEDRTRSAPVPVLARTYSTTGDRDDMYFSERACHDFFSFYGFDVEHVDRFEERELVNGHPIENDYWMIRMTFAKTRAIGQIAAGEFIYHPGEELRPKKPDA